MVKIKPAQNRTPGEQSHQGGSKTKNCIECASAIPIDARRCVHCSSQQDWTRYLTWSSTTLGLLVALVSVLTFAIPIWREVFHTPKPKPSVAVMDIGYCEAPRFTIANGGDGPLTIDSALFVRKDDGDTKSYSLQMAFPKSGSPIVKPNEIALVRATPENHSGNIYFQATAEQVMGLKDPRSKSNKDEYCAVVVRTIDVEGNANYTSSPVWSGGSCGIYDDEVSDLLDIVKKAPGWETSVAAECGSTGEVK
ncbi:MAG: hypothetical protein HY243_11445 [Proteobacteria bacterium]|nr:hypothetical protein [Pseudomonadota bacterium]